MSLLLRFLILSVGVPLALLFTLELTARLIPEPTPQGTVTLEMPTWMTRDENLRSRAATLTYSAEEVEWMRIFEPGPGFRVRLTPGSSSLVTNTFSVIPADRAQRSRVTANSLGFRGPEVRKPKPPETFRVAIFGDSSSFGWGVDDDETFAALTSQLLNQGEHAHGAVRGGHVMPTVEVLNFSIPGDSSEYGRLIAERYLPSLEADLVVLSFGANDAKRVFTPHPAQVDRFRSERQLQDVRQMLMQSALFRHLVRILTPSPPSALEGSGDRARVNAVPRERYAANLRALIRLSREHGASHVTLLTLCTPGNYREVAARVARRSNAGFVNGQTHLRESIAALSSGTLYPEYVQQMEERYPEFLRRDPLFYVTTDLCHPNRVGHRLVADVLSAHIKEHILKGTYDETST